MGRKSITRVQGIGAGLIPKDLNARAQMALHGLSDTPADDLAALLLSDQPIDSKTRSGLANAIVGRSRGLKIKVTNSRKQTWLVKLIRSMANVSQGRAIRSMVEDLGYTPAMNEAARQTASSTKSAEACYRLAREVDGWMSTIRATEPELADLDGLTLETVFFISRLERIEPKAAIDDSLIELVELLRQFRRIEDRSFGPNERFIT